MTTPEVVSRPSETVTVRSRVPVPAPSSRTVTVPSLETLVSRPSPWAETRKRSSPSGSSQCPSTSREPEAFSATVRVGVVICFGAPLTSQPWTSTVATAESLMPRPSSAV